MFTRSLKSAALAATIAFGIESALPGAVAPHALTSPACLGGKPGYLVPIFRQPVSQLVAEAGRPQTVQLQIVDDCGEALAEQNGGAVQISFSDQDASVDLHDVGGGIWEATWDPLNVAPLVTLNAVAFERSPSVSSIAAAIDVVVNPPGINAPARISAVVNAASSGQAKRQIVTPGSYVAIYGASLTASGEFSAGTIPLPSALNDTRVFLGGQSLRLDYASPGQINALIAQNLNPNTSYPLVIQRGSSQSVPAPLTVVEYQPGIYTLDLSGAGQGVVEIAGTTLLAAPTGDGSRPVQRGSEYLAIFATGLGPVVGANGEAQPADGAGAPLGSIFQTAGLVSATIGGVSAPVSFSGLTPTYVGLYQVNVQVPVTAPAGDGVPLTITVTDPVTGQSFQSNTVTLSVQ